MKINVFITLYKTKKDDDKELFIKEHIKDIYVPLEEKADYARAIVNSCYWVEDGNGERRISIDSVAKYMCSCMAIVKLYTNIECQTGDGKMLEDFNTLNGLGILDLIIQNVNQRELKEFNMVIEMTCNDFISNEYENHAYFSKQINRFGNLIGTALAPVIANIDSEKIEDMMNKIIN